MSTHWLISNYNWKYSSGIDLDYHYRYECRERSYEDDDDVCYSNCDGICRCGVIEDVEVKVDPYLIASEIFKDRSMVEVYCLDRILRKDKIHLSDNWNVEICSGYYGQEIEGVYFDGSSLLKTIDKLLALKSESEQIKFALNYEYGCLLDILKDLDFSLETVKRNEVKVSNQDYLERITEGSLRPYLNGGMYRAKEFNYRGPVCVLREDKSGNKVLVDGYHRYLASEGLEIIPVIVGRKND